MFRWRKDEFDFLNKPVAFYNRAWFILLVSITGVFGIGFMLGNIF